MRRLLPRDPRWLQVAFLGSFVVCGVAFGEVSPIQAPLCVAAAALAQRLCTRLRGMPSQGYLSPAITGLGVGFLLQSDLIWLPPLAAAVAISSKFVVRWKGKHVFNPSNFGLCACMLATHHAWVSPSQWGENALLIFFFVALGLAVVVRALRSDVSFAFMGFWALLAAGRVVYLEQPWSVLLHQLATGSFIIFVFFMISDPKTTPDSRTGRVIFAGLVAASAFVAQFGFWVMAAPIWALFFLAPLVPVLDRVLRGARYQWPSHAAHVAQLHPAGAR